MYCRWHGFCTSVQLATHSVGKPWSSCCDVLVPCARTTAWCSTLHEGDRWVRQLVTCIGCCCSSYRINIDCCHVIVIVFMNCVHFNCLLIINSCIEMQITAAASLWFVLQLTLDTFDNDDDDYDDNLSRFRAHRLELTPTKPTKQWHFQGTVQAWT